LVTLGVAFVPWFILRWRQEKSFTYDALVSLPLLTVGEGIKGKIRVLYSGKKIVGVNAIGVVGGEGGRGDVGVRE